MTYSSAVAYLYSLQKHGIKLGFETMTALVGRLGMPQTRYRTLHIAGTNGKGSTAAMAAAILQTAGYRVGLYTSPHLIEFRERIRVNGEMIAEADVARLTDELRLSANRTCRRRFSNVRRRWPFNILPIHRSMWRCWKLGWGEDSMPRMW